MTDKFNRLTRQNRFFIFLLILAALGWSLYGDAFSRISEAVLHREGSSHGIFVPFIAVYFLWLKLDKLKLIKNRTALFPGLGMLAIGFFLYLLGKTYGFQASFLSFLFIVAAFILFLFGPAIFAETAFPLFFLTTMIPLPTATYLQVAEWMRSITAWGSVAVTKALGVPVYREGYDVFMPGLHLVVDYACSGIRYLLSFFTFSIVYAVLFKKSTFSRLSFILGSIPFSILAGITRLSVVFLAAYYISPFWAEHKPHVFLSWVVFAVFLFGIILLDPNLIKCEDGKLFDS